MMLYFSPRVEAIKKLESYGVKLSDLYNKSTGKVNKRKLLPLKTVDYGLYKYLYDLLTYVDQKQRENKDYDALANIERMATNRLASDYSKEIKAKADETNETVIVKVVPSSAHEPRVSHQRQYGRTMTMARALELGITTDYGCQCDLMVISSSSEFKAVQEKTDLKVIK